MKINSLNTSFSGNLILKHPKLWTEDMLDAISENDTIQERLKNNNIIGNIATKIERNETLYPARHLKGDVLYKMNFIVKRDNLSFFEKLKDLFGIMSERFDINRHFHSEYTTVKRIKNIKM